MLHCLTRWEGQGSSDKLVYTNLYSVSQWDCTTVLRMANIISISPCATALQRQQQHSRGNNNTINFNTSTGRIKFYLWGKEGEEGGNLALNSLHSSYPLFNDIMYSKFRCAAGRGVMFSLTMYVTPFQHKVSTHLIRLILASLVQTLWLAENRAHRIHSNDLHAIKYV